MQWAPRREPIFCAKKPPAGARKLSADGRVIFYQYIPMNTAPTMIDVMPMIFL